MMMLSRVTPIKKWYHYDVCHINWYYINNKISHKYLLKLNMKIRKIVERLKIKKIIWTKGKKSLKNLMMTQLSSNDVFRCQKRNY